MVLDDIHDRRGQEACLPAKGTTRLKDQVKVRVALLEGSEHTDKALDIIALTGHQMSAPHVEPAELGEEVAEALLNDLKGLL